MTTIRTIIALAIAVAAGSAFTACSRHMPENTDDTLVRINHFVIEQDVMTAQRNYRCTGADAFFADSLPIYSQSTVAIQWPTRLGDYNIKPLQDSILHMAFGPAASDPSRAITASVNSPVGTEFYTMQPVDSIPSATPCMVLYRTVIASAVSFSQQFIVYQVMTSSYDGGNHGLASSRYLTYVFALNAVLDIGNAFLPNQEETLLKAIKDRLMTDFSATRLEELYDKGIFVDQLFVSPNFYVHGYDIVFHYNPFDIGAYSLGSLDVHVPYMQVASSLTPAMQRLMERNGV